MGKILIVDDNVDLLSVEYAVLKGMGHTVRKATDGNQALAQLAKESFDVMVLDLIMPNKEGIETIMEVRKTHTNLKIIAVTGGGAGGAKAYLEIASRLGAVAVMMKPFTVDELCTTVESVLRQ